MKKEYIITSLALVFWVKKSNRFWEKKYQATSIIDYVVQR